MILQDYLNSENYNELADSFTTDDHVQLITELQEIKIINIDDSCKPKFIKLISTFDDNLFIKYIFHIIDNQITYHPSNLPASTDDLKIKEFFDDDQLIKQMDVLTEYYKNTKKDY